MTERVTDAEIVAAARERFGCACASVGSWSDVDGREWVGCSITSDARPDTGTNWVLLGCCQTREALLWVVRDVDL